MTGFGRVVEGFASAVGLGGLEIQSTFLEAVGKADESGFAIDIGADFEVKFVEAAESVSNMDFDFRGVDGLVIGVGDGEVGGARAYARVDRWDGVRVRCLGQGRDGEQEGQSECDC